MNQKLIYLLNLLEEEFQGFDQVRVSAVLPVSPEKSPDLHPDPDEDERAAALLPTGVKVRTPRKEYFFPRDWFAVDGNSRILKQIEEIREELSR